RELSYRFRRGAPVSVRPIRALGSSRLWSMASPRLCERNQFCAPLLTSTGPASRPASSRFLIPCTMMPGASSLFPSLISNGRGPTVIVEGGNHGDEYEGPIVLGELVCTLDPGAVSGRLIFIPAINLSAVAAARRTSPFDDLNFNRAFPGDPLGSPTQQ